MNQIMNVCLLAVVCLSMCTQFVNGDGKYGIVTFNMRGVDGTIEFHPMEDGSIKITANLSGFATKQGWHVHLLPVDITLPPSMRCDNKFIGSHFDPLNAKDNPDYAIDCSEDNLTACEIGDLSGKFGSLTPMFSGIDDSGDLTLYGRYGIIGRSVKIHGTEDVCGTIYSSSEMGSSRTVAFLQATFINPFAGTIFFRQVEGESAVIFGKIFWTTNSSTTMGHKWHVHLNQPTDMHRKGNCMGIEGHYNPFNVNTSGNYKMYCNPENIISCEVGDLSGKHGTLTIASDTAEYSKYSFLYHDDFLNLTGTNSVIDRSIAIHSIAESTPVQGCAPLVAVERLSLSSTDGYFKTSQTSRFDRTKIESHRMYNTPNYRIFSSAIAPNQLCRYAFAAGHSTVYNPHKAPLMDRTDVTPDRYSVGNLSAKHMNIPSGGYFDELPIHGIETIASRSLGLSSGAPDSMTYTCRTLKPDYPDGANVKMARATFNGTVVGAIYFAQRDFGNSVYGVTYITVDIWYKNSSMSGTTDHNWHIHMYPPNASLSCGNSIGGHFNPFDADTKDNYSTECTIYSPLRCESGDLSKKHGVLNIDPPTLERESVTYTDSNLNLYGPAAYSIIGRSVGLHLPGGGGLFDCGAIKEMYKASNELAVSFPGDDTFNRVDFATMLTRDVADASPSDVLITGQSMMAGSDCVTANLTILGSSANTANGKLQDIRSQFSSMYTECADSARIVLPSAIVLLLSVLVINIFFM